MMLWEFDSDYLARFSKWFSSVHAWMVFVRTVASPERLGAFPPDTLSYNEMVSFPPFFTLSMMCDINNLDI